MLTLIAGRYSVVTLDEPEAFLHPPQAYQLGRNLAGARSVGDAAIRRGTHSTDVLSGLLEADESTPITVIRLGQENPVQG